MGYCCYSPVFRRYFTGTDVTFVESTPYFFGAGSLGDSTLEPDVIPISIPVPTLPKSLSPSLVMLPPHSPAPLQVYTCCLRPSASAPPPSSLSSTDLVSPLASDSLPIALWKGKRSCTIQNPIDQFVSTSSLSSHSLALFHISLVFLSQRQCMMHYFDFGWRQAMELKMEA
jgi:hypothetical protein